MKYILAILLMLFAVPGAYAADVTVSWDEVEGATGYRLYYGESPGNYDQNIDMGAAPPFTFNLNAGKRYYIAATAYCIEGESDYSNEVNHLVMDAPKITITVSYEIPIGD